MAKNPVEEFLQVKEAFGLGQLAPVAKSYGKNIAGGCARGKRAADVLAVALSHRRQLS